jgi:hypothetical protein
MWYVNVTSGVMGLARNSGQYSATKQFGTQVSEALSKNSVVRVNFYVTENSVGDRYYSDWSNLSVIASF